MASCTLNQAGLEALFVYQLHSDTHAWSMTQHNACVFLSAIDTLATDGSNTPDKLPVWDDESFIQVGERALLCPVRGWGLLAACCNSCRWIGPLPALHAISAVSAGGMLSMCAAVMPFGLE